MSYAELAAQLSAGFPFTGPLNSFGGFNLGPLAGVPPITIYTLAFGFPSGSPVPTMRTPAISYAIP